MAMPSARDVDSIRRRRWIIGLSVAIIIAVPAVGVLIGVDVGAYSSFDKTVAEYRAAGLPWVKEDLGLPEIPAGKNAAEALATANKGLGALDYVAFAGEVRGLLAEGKIEEARDALSPYRDNVRRALEASKLPHYRGPSDVDWGVIRTVPPEPRKLVYLLSLNAETASAGGDQATSLDTLGAMRRLASLLGQDPAWICAARQHHTLAQFYKSAAECGFHALGLRQPIEPYAALVADEHDPEVRRLLEGVMFTGLAGVRNMNHQPDGLLVQDEAEEWLRSHEPVREPAPSNPVIRSATTLYLKRCLNVHRLILKHKGDLPSLVRALRPLDEELPFGFNVSQQVAYLYSSQVSLPVESLLRTEARRRCALAALRYATRLRAGQERIEPNAEWIPDDPCNPGQKLRVGWLEGLLTFWSVGVDGVDEGGRNDRKPGGADDLAIQMPITKRGG